MLQKATLTGGSLPAFACALLVAACGGGQPPAGGAGPGGAPPPMVVSVVIAKAEAVPMVVELPGRTTPFAIAEVRPQVTGIIAQRSFTEGAEIRSGTVLYQIAPATYAAALESAKANLARAEAGRDAAQVRAARHADLVRIDAVSKQANDDAQAGLKLAVAEIAAARAAVDKASIDLEYTRVSAPISGRIGRSTVTAGALVTANQPTALATIQQLDPIYVDLTQSSTELLRLRRDLEAGRLQRLRDATVPVRLVLEDGSVYRVEGKLAFSEVTVDPGTGSVTLRAVFPNPRGELLPGMYVRAQLTQGLRRDAMVLPHAAVTHDPRGKALAMIVNAENKVEAREIEIAESQGDKWIVSRGLAAGDRVIVDGLQKIRPGMPVQAQPAGAGTAAATATGGAPATVATPGPKPAEPAKAAPGDSGPAAKTAPTAK